MTPPRRRPLRRDDFGIETSARSLAAIAAEIELGWSCLRAELRDLGWPARTPEGDRKPSRGWAYARCNADGCGVELHDQAALDAHKQATGHSHYGYAPLTPPMFTGIDYADPTGDQAVRLDSLHDDLIALQDAREDLGRAMRALATIARKHIPEAGALRHEPACSVATCDGVVESTANGGYRGLEKLCGHWVAKPGADPVCARHRSQERRTA